MRLLFLKLLSFYFFIFALSQIRFITKLNFFRHFSICFKNNNLILSLFQKRGRFLVENMGRVNFGPRMEEQRKGIDGCVQINGHIHHNWKMYPLPLENIESVDFSGNYKEGTPAFYRFHFETFGSSVGLARESSVSNRLTFS